MLSWNVSPSSDFDFDHASPWDYPLYKAESKIRSQRFFSSSFMKIFSMLSFSFKFVVSETAAKTETTRELSTEATWQTEETKRMVTKNSQRHGTICFPATLNTLVAPTTKSKA